MRFLKFFRLFSIFISAFLVACATELDLSKIDNSIHINESLVLPIGEAKISVKDALKKVNSDYLLTFEGDENVYIRIADSTVYKFRDFYLTQELSKFIHTSAQPSLVVPANMAINLPIHGSINLGINAPGRSERLDSVVITQSRIKAMIDMSPDLQVIPASNLSFSLVFDPARFIQHVPTNFTYFVPGYGKEVDITYSKVTFNTDTIINGNPTTGATNLPFTLNLRVNGLSAPVIANASSWIKLTLAFDTLDYEVAYGDFQPQKNGNSIEKYEMDFTQLLPENSFVRLANPSIKVTTQSTVGAELLFKMDYLKVFSAGSQPNEKFAWFENHTTKSKSLIVNGTHHYAEMPAFTDIPKFDKDNGELDMLFDTAPYPDTLEYRISVINDPNTTRKNLFMTPTSNVKVNVEATIPFHLKEGSFVQFSDSVLDVNTSIGTTLDKVDSAILVLNTYNGLPVKVRLTMTLWDENDTQISTTLKSSYEINSPQVDANGYAIIPSAGLKPQLIPVAMNKWQVEDLKKTRKIVYTVTIEGMDKNKQIHIRNTDNFRVKLGLFVNGTFTSKIGS